MTQVGVRHPYEGKVLDAIGIGSTIAEAEAALGSVTEDEEDNLVIQSVPGLSFETARRPNGEDLQRNKDARITNIFVFPIA